MWKMCNIRTCVYAISVQRTKDNNKKSNMCSRLSVSFNSYYHNQVAATAACRSMRIDGLTRVQIVQCVNTTTSCRHIASAKHQTVNTVATTETTQYRNTTTLQQKICDCPSLTYTTLQTKLLRANVLNQTTTSLFSR